MGEIINSITFKIMSMKIFDVLWAEEDNSDKGVEKGNYAGIT
ncbi:hypothetical protein STRDD10_01503 [Streptococcus sp. DD10]|nr:hypothetical protein STRDD10_01503 [Streptococcus sp. DD10]